MELFAKLRWVFVVLILLVVLIFVGWGLSVVARSIFSRSDSSGAGTVDETTVQSLEGVSVARYTVDGPIVASAQHRRFAIEVSQDVVSMRVFSDYGQKVIAEKSYKNNAEAFNAFVHSLEQSNATARFEGTDVDDDFADQGVCPSGRRFILELDDTIRRWTTSCDRQEGTAGGKMTTMRSLFARQIPNDDLRSLLKDTGLSSL